MQTSRVVRCVLVPAAAGLALSVTTALAYAQAAAGDARRPTFEVVSVKPSAGGRSLLPTVRGRQLTATNVPLRSVIRMAYGELVNGTLRQLQHNQIAGGPEWINVDRFDIVATMPEGPRAPGDLLLMIRSLLGDRFGLRAHNEMRELPVYALVMAGDDCRRGPGLQPVAGDCNAADGVAGGAVACGLRSGPGKIAGRGPIGLLISNTGLAPFLDRPLIDRTSLTGNFDVQLQWTPTPDQIPGRLRGNANVGELIRGAGVSPDAPSLFTAVQEQLGLKLESTRASIDVLVIDSVERPLEN